MSASVGDHRPNAWLQSPQVMASIAPAKSESAAHGAVRVASSLTSTTGSSFAVWEPDGEGEADEQEDDDDGEEGAGEQCLI